MHKGEQQRAHLIDVARDLFAEQGYEATTNKALNQAAGTSDGLLYYYFPHGKQDILDTIVKEGLIQRVGEVTIDFSAATTRQELSETLVAMIAQVWGMFAREDNYQSFLITVRNRMLLSKHNASWLEQYTSLLQQRIEAALAQVMPTLGYRQAQAPVLAKVVIALVITPLYTELLLGNRRELSATQKTTLQEEVAFILHD
ncbi:TetR/AcrR family transcriptional regulator [Lacticaseibacillus jixiensis]|uniref:TetR/AcrR family transcriptional regulator n=1 Tax=Lacticaseibacillus jixiensis TaxID=3231926 RepID=UPI0036F2E81D